MLLLNTFYLTQIPNKHLSKIEQVYNIKKPKIIFMQLFIDVRQKRNMKNQFKQSWPLHQSIKKLILSKNDGALRESGLIINSNIYVCYY